ncbi:arginyl-tRNA-protein transferase [Bosea sp. AAP35]|uniref:arginyltransferase n=1 Tax=Bosea sp. AAP35 TaxID=1523417 RepID=UPI0006B989A1|nr:arginyltransferase [Bosea sp. AAP35]KPF72675.1 arginyl-tRNA-protein transferase [Bosea sp. AAP35]
MTRPLRDAPQFYLTSATTCPYLPGREERKVFTHLVGGRARDLNNVLSQGGFRRSQSIAYRPACETCRACISVRVLVNEFRPSRSFRKVMARNSDLIGEGLPPRPRSEHYSLFRSYLDERHPDGGMATMSALDFAMMVEDTHVDTTLIEYRRRGPDSGFTGRGRGDLYAMALTDTLSDGLSMVYSVFDPSLIARSLGTFMVLDHIERARRLRLPYVYLGYWVDGSPKMAYKERFQPQERLMAQGWERAE